MTEFERITKEYLEQASKLGADVLLMGRADGVLSFGINGSLQEISMIYAEFLLAQNDPAEEIRDGAKQVITLLKKKGLIKEGEKVTAEKLDDTVRLFNLIRNGD